MQTAPDTTARGELRSALEASEIATRPDGDGFLAKARAVLAEIRACDERFGQSDGIAEALIAIALYEAQISGIDLCRPSVSFALEKAGVSVPVRS